jgi:hypothetical protein
LQSQAHFFTLYWDQFNDFDSFSSFIVKSNKISPTYFLINSHEIQKKPKYQYFVQSKKNSIPNILPPVYHVLPIPLSRPLQLLAQKRFWDNLISLYFQHIHSKVPLFSIHSFNPETADKNLLSAIYYGGLYCRQDKPPEIISYFEEYAKQNIKEIIKVISLTNTQAMTIYSTIMVFGGKLSLSRACLAHAIRMSYSLGLHINVKSISPAQQYNRLILFSKIRAISLSISGMSSLALDQITEFGHFDANILTPQWQIPNFKSVFYFDTEDENIIYGFCCDAYTKLHCDCSMSVWTINNCSDNYIEEKFEKVSNSMNQKYIKCIQTFELLLKEFPCFENTILGNKYQVKLLYHDFNMERYKILKTRAKSFKSKLISDMINETSLIFEYVVASERFNQHTHIYPYTAGLNFINLYPSCNESQKKVVKDKLHKIVDYLSNHFCVDKLAYLIIKNEYESILK